MSQFFNLKKELVLEIPFPQEKLITILNRLSLPQLNSVHEAPFEQKRLVILVSFREFLKGKLLLEEYSEIANLLKMTFPLESRTTEQEDYELMIYEAADISLYVRRFVSKHGSMFGGYMDTQWNYFNKYKHLLNDLSAPFSNHSPLEEE